MGADVRGLKESRLKWTGSGRRATAPDADLAVDGNHTHDRMGSCSSSAPACALPFSSVTACRPGSGRLGASKDHL